MILAKVSWDLEKLLKAMSKKRKKVWFRDNYFHFQIFETFGNLEIYFNINLSRFLWTVASNFEISYTAWWLNFWRTI